MYTSMNFVHAQRGQKKVPDHGEKPETNNNLLSSRVLYYKQASFNLIQYVSQSAVALRTSS